MGANLPGYRAGESVSPREILYALKPQPAYLPGGGLFDSGFLDNSNTGATHILRAGLFVGKTTTGGKWRPIPRTQVNGTSGAVTEVILDDASAFKVGDVITIGADTGIEITAIDYDTNTITIASTTVADDEAVFAEGGSGVAMGILDDTVDLLDADGNAVDQVGRILIAGAVDYDKLLGDKAAILATWSTHKLDGIQVWDDGARLA